MNRAGVAPGNAAELIRSALEAKLRAIGGYDDILWKIRAGYIAILYGALALLLGTQGISSFCAIVGDRNLSLSLLILIAGFSAAAVLVDLAYKRKKLKVIVSRDFLMRVAYDHVCESHGQLKALLQISGEASVSDIRLFHPQGDATRAYFRKCASNFILIQLPLYSITPILAIVIHRLSSCGP
jgi:hypothetical protein